MVTVGLDPVVKREIVDQTHLTVRDQSGERKLLVEQGRGPGGFGGPAVAILQDAAKALVPVAAVVLL